MLFEDRLHKRQHTMKILVGIQFIISFLGIIISVLEIYDSAEEIPYISMMQQLKAMNPKALAEKYCILAINITFLIFSFIGYPGYKYDSSCLIVFHVLSTSILSTCVSIYFVYMLVEERSFTGLLYLLCPVFGIFLSFAGFSFIQFIFQRPGEGIQEPIIPKCCIICENSVIVLVNFDCAHGVCQECALKTKKCPLCNEN